LDRLAWLMDGSNGKRRIGNDHRHRAGAATAPAERRMKMDLMKKRNKAIELIDDIFGDTSVSKETTLEHLEEILDAVEGKAELLRGEINDD